MLGMTNLTITTTSQILLLNFTKSYKPNAVILDIEKKDMSITFYFPTNIYNVEKEGFFETIIEKIIHLKDPQDRIMETKIEIKYLQQANKEYYFSRGELVRYRGFFDTDEPIPMVTNLFIGLQT